MKFTIRGTAVSMALLTVFGATHAEEDAAPSPTAAAAPALAAAARAGLNYNPSDFYAPNDFQTTDSGEGAFRLFCEPGKLLRADPLVFPGEPGRGHLHQFFGNKNVSASTTPANIRNSGGSTCSGGPLNRSAYWYPALIDTSKNVTITPDQIIVYYKGEPPGIKKIPVGLSMVAGADAETGQTSSRINWKCGNTGNNATIPTCAPGKELYASIDFPMCWNGKDLSSPNHRSHMAYIFYDNGRPTCPSSHPVEIPRITYVIGFTVKAGESTANWKLSSDGSRPAGSTMHADWINGWNWFNTQKTVLTSDVWYKNCLALKRDCNTSNLGNNIGLSSPTAVSSNRKPVPN